jgi:hypothetical protein
MANSYINKKADLTTTDTTTLYTVPTASAAIIKSLLVCNDAGSACTFTATITEPTTSDVFKLFNTKSIAANTTTELLDKPLVLQESEVLKVTAGDANELHVIASIMEVKPREVTT